VSSREVDAGHAHSRSTTTIEITRCEFQTREQARAASRLAIDRTIDDRLLLSPLAERRCFVFPRGARRLGKKFEFSHGISVIRYRRRRARISHRISSDRILASVVATLTRVRVDRLGPQVRELSDFELSRRIEISDSRLPDHPSKKKNIYIYIHTYIYIYT